MLNGKFPIVVIVSLKYIPVMVILKLLPKLTIIGEVVLGLTSYFEKFWMAMS